MPMNKNEESWLVRIDDYRVVYSILKDTALILIIRHRRERSTQIKIVSSCSTRYGRLFKEAAVGEFAGRMHTDLIDCVQWAVNKSKV